MGLTVQAEGRPSGTGPGSFGGELRGVTEFTGHIVCVNCSLQEARAAQPHLTKLYQFTHVNPEQGQVVIQVETFLDPAEQMRWDSIVGPSHQLQMRATDNTIKALTAEENLFKTLTITGLLRSTSVLDIHRVEVSG